MDANEEAGKHYWPRNELKDATSSQSPGLALSFLGKPTKSRTARMDCLCPTAHSNLGFLLLTQPCLQ
jgi:hypothetical protein